MNLHQILVLAGAIVGLLLGIFQKPNVPASFFHVIPFPLVSASVGAVVGNLIASIATDSKKE